MAVILITILPIFGLIALGFAAAKLGIIDIHAGRGLSSFVFNVAIPALLFRTIATLPPGVGAPWGLWLAFFGGVSITWLVASLLARFIPTLAVDGGAEAAMASCFGNLALLGAPLALSFFGPQAGVPLGMIISIHAPLLWTASTLQCELARKDPGLSLAGVFKGLVKNLATNTIVVALLLGSLWRYTGLGLTPIIDRMLAMLADSSVTVALFALGVSLAGYRLGRAKASSAFLITMKMLFMPLMVFFLTRTFVPLPPLWAKTAVLFAAMPTGANAFLFAQKYKQAVAPVSLSITLGTALSIVTVALLLYAMDQGLI